MSNVSALPPVKGYSADVRLTLYIGSTSYKIAQIREDRFILRQETRLPGTTGIVHVQIDDQLTRKRATWEASDAPRSLVMATFQPID